MDDKTELSIEELVKQRPVLTEEEMNEFYTYEEAVDEAMNLLDEEMAKILKQTRKAEELYYDGLDLEQESDYKSAYFYFRLAADLGIDIVTGGLKSSEMIVIAGQGRTEKTSLALSIAKNVAVDENIPCSFFSMEMSNVKLVNRLISSVCDIDGNKILNGKLNHDEWEKLDEHISRLTASPLYIDDKPAITIDELRDRMRKLLSEHGVKLFIIDSLQLINCYKYNRSDELFECMRSLRELADELRVTIITTGLLGSGTEEKHRYPKMSDHQEFMIFNDFADYSVFLYRPDHYHVRTIEEKIEGINFGCLTIMKRGFEQMGGGILRYNTERNSFNEWD